jgi:hypothetical protein
MVDYCEMIAGKINQSALLLRNEFSFSSISTESLLKTELETTKRGSQRLTVLANGQRSGY